MFVPRSLGGPEVDRRHRVRRHRGAVTRRRLDRVDVDDPQHVVLQLLARARGCPRDPRHASPARAWRVLGPIGRAEPAGDGAVRLSGRFPFTREPPRIVVLRGCAPHARRLRRPSGDPCSCLVKRSRSSTPGTSAGLRGDRGATTSSSRARSCPSSAPRTRSSRPPPGRAHFRVVVLRAARLADRGRPARSRSPLARRVRRARRNEGPREARSPSRPSRSCSSQSHATSLLRAARSLLFESVESAWQTSLTGDPISREQRLAIRIAATNTMRAGIEVVDSVFALAGGGACSDDSPLQRCWRVSRSEQPTSSSRTASCHSGQVILGQPAEDFRM